ncbi:hypothetical protein BU16DRAFT_558220 [Lophium mytilinum]|uniref:Rhodopsin domain-containing protein n=1 Tax=Lophium mytilinum TaxID=390894 RepID=A0A6A6R0C0_9PEZI|nr:hypothetical protein BU16DRAFT_558220 [Lophium mytilinum]
MPYIAPDPKLLKSIPPEIFETLPGQPPPPGMSSNFIDPPTRVPIVLGVSITLFVLASVCYLVRMWTKSLIMKKWQWDDLTITLGFMCSIVYFVAMIWGSVYGATGRHAWDVKLATELNVATLHQDYITTIMVGATLSGIFYVAVTITAFVLNSPWHGEALLDTILSWHYLKFAEFAIPTGVIGMVVDWYLLFLPMPALWILHMSFGRKIGVMLVFMTGGLAAIASTITLYYRVKIQNDLSDAPWKVAYVLLWSQIEMFAGVAASSMPSVRQFVSRQDVFKSWGPSLKRSIFRSSSAGQQEKMPGHVATLREWIGSQVSRKADSQKDPAVESGGGSDTLVHLTVT